MAQNEGSAGQAPSRPKESLRYLLNQLRELVATILSILLGSFLLSLGTAGLVLFVASVVWMNGINAGIFGTIGLVFTVFPYAVYALLWIQRYKL